MKRILSAVALLGVLLIAATASAQFRDKAVLLTLGAGPVLASDADTGDKINGNVAGFTLEKVLADGKFNAGFSIIWMWADGTVTNEDQSQTRVSVSGVPFMLTGRYNFLNSKFTANIGLGLGIHTTTRYLEEGTIQERSTTTSGMAVSIPVELAYFLDPDMYLQVTYSPSWMNTTPLRDDLAHSFALGIGFQWGAN